MGKIQISLRIDPRLLREIEEGFPPCFPGMGGRTESIEKALKSLRKR
jgi:hypothetical protein